VKIILERDIELCVDCVHFIANGDAPEDKPGFVERVRTLWDTSDANEPPGSHWELVVGSGEGGFSSHMCDGCNSSLGGDRYPGKALLYGPEETNASK
tara:strand:- start:380 stop:670 length:291 start_codon:yes stop_codon:yes gene_type:complete